jgi:flagellar basal body-associated protein FliL
MGLEPMGMAVAVAVVVVVVVVAVITKQQTKDGTNRVIPRHPQLPMAQMLTASGTNTTNSSSIMDSRVVINDLAQLNV